MFVLRYDMILYSRSGDRGTEWLISASEDDVFVKLAISTRLDRM